jgi:uncharacterized protein
VLARKFARVGFVNDFAGVMKPEETEKLNASASELLSSNGVDAAIITITSLEGEAIEKVSIEIGRAWKVGAGQRGDGIVLCLAIEDRQSRIDVTRSLEPVLTNEECGLILKKARSWFTQGEYGRGCDEVIRLIKEEITMAERGKEPTSGS